MVSGGLVRAELPGLGGGGEVRQLRETGAHKSIPVFGWNSAPQTPVADHVELDAHAYRFQLRANGLIGDGPLGGGSPQYGCKRGHDPCIAFCYYQVKAICYHNRATVDL